MVWAKLDDEILDNEKIVNAGPLGFALHVAAITWCCRNLTDGFIPRSKVRALLDFDGLHVKTGEGEFVMHQKAVEPLDLADELVVLGLWLEDDERRGFWLNDFLDYNPTKEKVLSERERGRVRAKASHEARQKADLPAATSSPEDAPKLRSDFGSASDGPVPVPVPIKDPPPTRAREGVSVVVDPVAPLEDDARKVWAGKTLTAAPDCPVETVWEGFCGHFAGQVFPNRQAVLGRWGNWISRQTKFDAKERVRERDRGSGKRGAETTKQPFDPNAPWMKLGDTGS